MRLRGILLKKNIYILQIQKLHFEPQTNGIIDMGWGTMGMSSR